MSFKLKDVVPWGRSLAEYQQMFNLTDTDLKLSILDCGGGPASFNTELTPLGGTVISCDPIYQFTAAEIAERIAATYPIIVQGLRDTQERFIWDHFDSPDALGAGRMVAMEKFLEDFPRGLQEGRYRPEILPNLPFNKGEFDLALSGHLLFTYSEQLSFEFHLKAILEMLRVAKEVRIFPLLENFTGEISPHLEGIKQQLNRGNYRWQIQGVRYEFQKGGNEMLQIYA